MLDHDRDPNGPRLYSSATASVPRWPPRRVVALQDPQYVSGDAQAPDPLGVLGVEGLVEVEQAAEKRRIRGALVDEDV